jgi:predicted PilT family ATPase
MNNLDFVFSQFYQIADNKLYSGKFWLRKEKGITNVRLEYTEGVKQNIYIYGDKVVIVDAKGKEKSFSISRTPVFAVLTGKLNLTKEQTEIVENSDQSLKIKISSYKSGEITLLFSKYEFTKNIKDLEGWIYKEEQRETLFTFDPDTWSVKNAKNVPLDVFEKRH